MEAVGFDGWDQPSRIFLVVPPGISVPDTVELAICVELPGAGVLMLHQAAVFGSHPAEWLEGVWAPGEAAGVVLVTEGWLTEAPGREPVEVRVVTVHMRDGGTHSGVQRRDGEFTVVQPGAARSEVQGDIPAALRRYLGTGLPRPQVGSLLRRVVLGQVIKAVAASQLESQSLGQDGLDEVVLEMLPAVVAARCRDLAAATTDGGGLVADLGRLLTPSGGVDGALPRVAPEVVRSVVGRLLAMPDSRFDASRLQMLAAQPGVTDPGWWGSRHFLNRMEQLAPVEQDAYEGLEALFPDLGMPGRVRAGLDTIIPR